MEKRILIIVCIFLIGALLLQACTKGNQDNINNQPANGTSTTNNGDSSSNGETSSSKDSNKFQSRTIKFLSIWPEDKKTDNGWLISELSRQYGETVDGFKLDFEYVSIDQLDQKVKILLSSNDLPEVCAYESGVRLIPVIESGQILDVEKIFTELGIFDCLEGSSVNLLKKLVNGKGLYCAPLGMNVEGFWYNKALFKKAGIEKVPKTWDELLEACEKLKAAGITPIVQGGSDRWPMTRLLNAYLVRSVGLDAVENAMSGKTHFTDPEYVAAAQMFVDMAKKGYFATGMNTIDPGTATSMLMNGQAAMNYDGSWKVASLNSDENTAGPEGIGFFNVPLVNNTSTSNDYSMNCGNVLIFSSKKYDEAVADWMKFVFPRIGDFAMQQQGAFKGYKITKMPKNMSYYTKLVADALSSADNAFLWFEAKMDNETSTLAQNDISLLYTGEMTAEEYMRQLEESAAKARNTNK